MNRPPHRFLAPPAQRCLLTALLSLSVAGACSSSSDAPATPITFNVAVTTLDGKAPTETVQLRCDHEDGKALSTLAVAFAITTTPENNFVLRPANACGTSTRCGYARIRGLSATGEVLASVDTATTAGVLELDGLRLAEVAKIEVSLFRGLDQQPLLNPDNTEVTAAVSPTFVAPSECADENLGTGGAGSGGAGGAGAGGESPLTPPGGAGGESMTPGAGGAAGAGAAPLGGAAGDAALAGMGGA
jgi:hypothetical protein